MTKHPEPKQGITPDGEQMHYSVGAVIRANGKYFLIERAQFPPGFAGPAGHVDQGEEPDDALTREVAEETGLTVVSQSLLFREIVPNNPCGYGITTHAWWLYAVEVSGDPAVDVREAKSWDWFTSQQIQGLDLEDVWGHWFRKLGTI